MVLQGINHRELKAQVKNLEREGYHLANFLALHTIDDFRGDRRDYVLRTMLSHQRLQQMAYLQILDKDGTPIVNLTSGDKPFTAPLDVAQKSATAMVLVQHAYVLQNGDRITEFAKPIFTNGQKTGTVRLGLFYPQKPVLTLEKISLLATICFYILSGVIIAFFSYSGVVRSLIRFKNSIVSGPKEASSSTAKLVTQADISQSLKQIQTTWSDVRKQFDRINATNQELTTRVSVLNYEHHKTEAVLDHINAGILVTDTQNTIMLINAYLLNLFCLDRKAVIDQPAERILTHPELAYFSQYVCSPDMSQPSNAVEVQFSEMAPGETFLLSNLLLGEDHHPIGKLFILRTITREKVLEQTTKDFTAHLSHELLTPLTTIHSYSEMLADNEVAGVEMRKEFINTINEETSRLARLVKDILNFSKLEAGTLTLDKGLVRSDWLFTDSLAAVEGTAQKKNISITKTLPDNFPSIIGDKEQLKGCLINILGNAVKYTDTNGTIQFELTEMEDMVVFMVKDNGCGIVEEDIPFIFNKYFRSAQSAVAEQQGTGLGLAIAAEIVSLHNGTIEVHSQPGEETVFSVKLPKEEYYLGEEDQSTSGRRRVSHPAGH